MNPAKGFTPYPVSTIGYDTKNPRWEVVDNYTMSHSHPASRPNASALQNTLAASEAAELPDISVSPAQAKFMALMLRMLNVTHALEVGTLGGYSAIWLASENPQLHVTTVEYDARFVEVARKNIEHAGLLERIEVINATGFDALALLKEEVLRGDRPRFGFVFIDADKPNSWNYFNMAADMCQSKAAICVDNVVRDGRVADADDQHPHILGGRLVIENAGKDPRVDTAVVQTVGCKGYDGFLWAVVN
ncbi:S-adenosyl-L-methionine-dependent methyltransferase [Lasiosphaeria ovina]|uniref:S-adenosyl-L-methionine-dependent methyltransferase n=1 Tax=Lasiosphaeria ovina TaxID=92902 RepID=A0AAE0KAJ0_9PEZI|nr:S-adenosyl-L-methionine-dependent methyltransferase [Lasiosphaeria ovina]